jgi:hypothetical protein
MTKEQELQDLREALQEASRVEKEKQRAYKKFLGSPLGEEPLQGYNKNEVKRASEEYREAKEKRRALQEKYKEAMKSKPR